MVVVGDHGDDGADLAVLGDGRAGEDGNIGVAREVAGTADAVHHLRAADVRGVDVPVKVGFNGGVDGEDDAEAADHFRAVRYLRGTEHQLVAEEVHIPVNAFQAVVRNGQGTAGCPEFHAAFPDQTDHGVLNDFRVHFEGGNGACSRPRAPSTAFATSPTPD